MRRLARRGPTTAAPIMAPARPLVRCSTGTRATSARKLPSPVCLASRPAARPMASVTVPGQLRTTRAPSAGEVGMGRVGWRVVAFVLTGVGLLAFGLLGRAQAQETQAPVVFARPSVSMPDGGSAGLTLFNNTTAELLLTVRVAPADAFSVETSAASVGPGGSVAL